VFIKKTNVDLINKIKSFASTFMFYAVTYAADDNTHDSIHISFNDMH